MLIRILDVLLSAVVVGMFVFVAAMTVDVMFTLKDAVMDMISRLLIGLKQKARKRRYENSESRH